MSDKIFIDTNILLYAYDIDAGVKYETAKKLVRQCWETASGVVSVQVLSEFFVRATRQNDPFMRLEEAEFIVKNISNSWDALHHIYPGIKIAPISNYEDEDFTVEIVIPKSFSIDQVEERCHQECIKIEDEYDLFILPRVIYE